MFFLAHTDWSGFLKGVRQFLGRSCASTVFVFGPSLVDLLLLLLKRCVVPSISMNGSKVVSKGEATQNLSEELFLTLRYAEDLFLDAKDLRERHLIKTMKGLVEGGACINHQNETLNTPLHLSAVAGYEMLTRVMLQQLGADAGMKNQHGQSAKDIASPGVLQVFHDEELIALYNAAKYSNVIEFITILTHSTSSSWYNPSTTPQVLLHLSVKACNYSVVHYLITATNTPIDCIVAGYTPLYHALRSTNHNLILFLISNGAKISMISQPEIKSVLITHDRIVQQVLTDKEYVRPTDTLIESVHYFRWSAGCTSSLEDLEGKSAVFLKQVSNFTPPKWV